MSDLPDDIYSFKIGRFNCSVINDGYTDYATADMLFGFAPEEELGERLQTYGLNPDRIRCYGNCLIIDNNSELILVDAGFGPISAEYPGAGNAGNLVKNLKKSGYNPKDIDSVIFTHYHTDHIGGGIDRQGNPSFPNAEIYMNEKDWEKGCSMESFGKKVLLTLKSQMRYFESETEIRPGVKAIPAPGHTPGHTIIKIGSDREEFLYISDLAAHLIHFQYPHWSMKHEYDPELAAGTRREIFTYAADRNIPILTYHLPFPGLGLLGKSGAGWEWRAL